MACTVLGHRRSQRRIRFNDLEHRWVSTCIRCNVRLCRDAFGDWMMASASPRMLKPAADREFDDTDDVRAGLYENVQRPTSGRDEFPSTNGSVQHATETHIIVRQLLDDVLDGKVAPPGARGALFFVVDELRAKGGMDEQARQAEQISVGIQQLQSALQRGAEDEAVLARRDLKELAGVVEHSAFWLASPTSPQA